MATKAQIKANRKNARKSTGPRTDEGKAAVSKNAVKHGLFAKEAVISGEDQAYYDALHDEILAELAPSGVMETLLAERVVSLTWRLKRAVRFENQLIEVLIEQEELRMQEQKRYEPAVSERLRKFKDKLKKPDPGLILGRVIERDYSYKPKIDRLVLYERRIENSLFRTIKELDRRKLARQTADERGRKRDDGGGTADDGGGTMDEGRGMKDELKKLIPQGQSQLPAFSRKSEVRNPKSEIHPQGTSSNEQNPNFAKQSQLPAFSRKFEIHPTGMKPRTQISGLSRAKPRERRTQKFAKQSQSFDTSTLLSAGSAQDKLADEQDVTSCNKEDYENTLHTESDEDKADLHFCTSAADKTGPK
jgi:hypothetical protein